MSQKPPLEAEFQKDVDLISGLDVVPLILDIVCKTTGMRFAAVARVTESRWIACQTLDKINFGLAAGGELSVETTICDEIRNNRQPVVVDHVAEDPAFCTHHTPITYGLQSYISFPIIRRDGRFFGTLCAIDPEPHKVKTPEIMGLFKLFSELIAFHIDANDKMENTERELATGKKEQEIREQFIAVLGHDLRNPLTAMQSGMKLLTKIHSDEKSIQLMDLMGASLRRSFRLIDDVLDFARGKLGGGIPIHREIQMIQPALEQVISEIRSSAPEREIHTVLDFPVEVNVDQGRLTQLFSNLLGNAVTHGQKDKPIYVHGSVHGGMLTLSVANQGRPIPPELLEKLFEPFYRHLASPHSHGLGLGLFIASEIARGHEGTIAVASDVNETRFTLSIPT